MTKFLSLLVLAPMVAFAQTQPAPAQPQQPACPQPAAKIKCTASLNKLPVQNGVSLDARVKCDQVSRVQVVFFNSATGSRICSNGNFTANTSEASAPCMNGATYNSAKTLKYDYMIIDPDRSIVSPEEGSGGMLTKEPTFNAAPEVYLSMNATVTPAWSWSGLGWGKGKNWSARISVFVKDLDLEKDEAVQAIHTQLIDVTNGSEQVLEDRNKPYQLAKTDEIVNFDVKHSMTKEGVHSGQLKLGTNTLIVRVFDATNGNMKPKDSPPITVIISE